MTNGLHCIKCNTEIYLTDDSPPVGSEAITNGYISNDGDKYACINCILEDYIKHRTNAMIMRQEFEMVPELEELIYEKYKSTKSLRHRYN